MDFVSVTILVSYKNAVNQIRKLADWQVMQSAGYFDRK